METDQRDKEEGEESSRHENTKETKCVRDLIPSPQTD
jgi:hypothetical protein